MVGDCGWLLLVLIKNRIIWGNFPNSDSQPAIVTIITTPLLVYCFHTCSFIHSILVLVLQKKSMFQNWQTLLKVWENANKFGKRFGEISDCYIVWEFCTSLPFPLLGSPAVKQRMQICFWEMITQFLHNSSPPSITLHNPGFIALHIPSYPSITRGRFHKPLSLKN